MGDMKKAFLDFCDSTKKGATTATDKTIKKICTDAKLYTKTFTANDVDIEFRKCIGNQKKDVDYEGFVTFLDKFFIPAYAKANKKDEKAVSEEIKEKINKGPVAHNATKVSKDGATERLTDVKGYTGARKEAFDQETGKGKGKEGREYVVDDKAASGYVGGYKGKDTYDKKK